MQQKVITATPGTQGYILVRAIKTDASGNITYSDYTSLPYTVPGTSPSGGNILTVNTNGDVQLSGGSIYAGSFPAGAGTLDVVTGTTTGTGVVLNQTGLASFASGVREFYIQASTGKAYFAGTISTSYTDLTGTHTLNIGQDAGGSGKSGIYIDPNNYWYSDGTWSAKGSDIAGALVGSQILKPSSVSSLTSSWNSSTSLTISWVFDTTSIVPGVSSNLNTKDFILTLTAGSTTKTVIVQANKSSSAQSYTLTPTLNQSLFGVVQTVFGITVAAEDTFGNIGPVSPVSGTLAGATYYSPLSAPTSLTITPVNNGYTVGYTTPGDPSFAYIQIAESTASSSGPFNTVYTGALNPVTIIASNLSARWVEARFVDVLGVATSWYVYGSSVQPVSPTTISTAAPQLVTVNSAGFTNSGPFISITNATGTTTIIYTTGTTAHNFVNGDKVVISGITGGTGFNTSGIVSNVTLYTFQLASQSASGTPTSYTGAVVQYTGTGEDVSITITAYNKSITAASGTSTITYTTGTTAHGFVNGDEVVISGITGGTGFNTSGIVSGVTTYTFQLESQSASGTPTSYTGAVVQYTGVSYIAKLISGSHTGYFYLTPDGTSSTSQSFTILKRDMYNQFGAYYYTFSGSFITTGSNGINNSGAGITSFSRTSTITSATPVLATFAVADGYTATYDFSATNATYGEVYQKHTTWGSITIPIDYLTGTYVSNTTNQLVLSGVTDVDGNVITTAGDINGAFPTGYQIFGTSVPNNTYVTAVSYSAPNFTLTLNNSLSGTGSGTYKANGLVYSGTSPANITNNLYDQFYVIVRYYDDFGFSSAVSGVSPVTPNNPSSISNFSNAVNIGGTAGSVYVGAALKSAIISTVSGSGALMTYTTSAAHGLSNTDVVTVSGVIVGGTTVNYYNVTGYAITVTGTTTFTIAGAQTGAGTGGVVANNGARVFMASSLNTNNTSGYAGIFAFDNTGATATTSLIANPGSNGYTFKTINANIADWVIDSTHIQNTLGASSNYVGLSATGPYSFWAGSGTSGNTTGNANFSVTPTGNVLAKNISIVGSGVVNGIWASGNGTTVTYTTNTAHGLVPGQYVNITGLGVGYNVSNVPIATVPTSTTFTIANSGASSSYGTTVTTAVANPVGTTTVTLNTLYTVTAGMIVTGTGVPANTYVVSATSVSGQTVLLLTNAVTAGSSITLSFSNGGIVIPTLLSAGGLFTVTGTGAFSSTSANITGSITANYGSVQGNLKVGGSVYSGITLAQSVIAVLSGVGTVRYALSGAHSLTTNSTVYVSGIAPSGYSGVFKVTGVNTSTTTATASAGTAASTVVLNSPPTVAVATGQMVIGSGLPTGLTTVATITNPTNIILSQNSVLSNTNLTFVSGTIITTATNSTAVTASTAVTLSVSNPSTATGQYITGAGIPNGTTITRVSGTSITTSVPITIPSVTTLSFYSPTVLTTAVGTAGAGSSTINLSVANSNIAPGMIVTGAGIPANTYVISNPSPWTSVTLNNSVFLSSVLLTFTAGTFDVINATTGGATISSVDPIAQVTDITSGYILNPTGLVFNNATTQGITSINGNTGLFTTSSANIGNWLVSSSAISKTSVAGTVYLNSGTTNASITAVSSTGSSATFTTSAPHGFITNQYVTISGFGTSTVTYNNAITTQLIVLSSTTFSVANTGTGTPTSYGIATVSDVPSIYTVNSGGTYSAGLAGANNSTDRVFWAGLSKTSSNFYVQADGTLFASSANISGNVTANAIVANTSISTANFSLTGTSGDLWSSTGAFQFGGASGIKYSGSGNITIGSSGNPVTINTSTGAVTISGTITANALASGTITNAGTITGGTIQSIGSGNQIVMTNGTLQFTDPTGTSVGSIQANATGSIRFWADSGATLPSMTIYNSTGAVPNTTVMHQPLALWADDAILSTSAGSRSASRNILIRSSAAITTAGHAGTGGTGADAVYNGDIWVQYV